VTSYTLIRSLPTSEPEFLRSVYRGTLPSVLTDRQRQCRIFYDLAMFHERPINYRCRRRNNRHQTANTWAKTVLPVMDRSVRHARARLEIGRQAIRICLARDIVAAMNFQQQRAPLVRPCPPWIFSSASRAREYGQRRFPPILATSSQASLTAPPKPTGYQTTVTYTNQQTTETVWTYTCRRSGSTLSYIGIYAT
jgi:hypothetical protein